MSHILVIGAGVIGLQTANDLLDEGYKVTILAKHWPGDESIEYTSPWAGAIWRTQALPDQVEVCDWQKQSYAFWTDIINNRPEDAEAMGMQLLPFTIYSDEEQSTPVTPRTWYSTTVTSFTLLPPSSLPIPGPKSAHTFTSVVINPTRYLQHLLSRATSLGAATICATLPVPSSFPTALSAALTHLPSAPSLVVNCTGLGAFHLGDAAMYPVRGQTLLVRMTPAPAYPRVTLYDSSPVTYVVPRRETEFSEGPSDATYFVGGTLDKGNWDGAPSAEVSVGILERVREVVRGWASEEVEIEVLREQVGLRPGREGGPRVEGEEVDVGGGKVRVVHQYGHAGAGFQNSIGSSRKAVALVRDMLG